MTHRTQLFRIQRGSKSVNASKRLNPYLSPTQYLLIQHTTCMRSRDSSVGIATGFGLDGQGVGGRVPGRGKIFLLSTSSRPVLGPTQPLIQRAPGALSSGKSSRGVKLTTHLQQVPRSRIHGSTNPLLHTSSWRSA
jgi:hypothetical protein